MFLVLVMTTMSLNAYSFFNFFENEPDTSSYPKQTLRKVLEQCVDIASAKYLKSKTNIMFSETGSLDDGIQDSILMYCNDDFAAYLEVTKVNHEQVYEDHVVAPAQEAIAEHNEVIRQESIRKRKEIRKQARLREVETISSKIEEGFEKQKQINKAKPLDRLKMIMDLKK